jgi:hypothetical protein
MAEERPLVHVFVVQESMPLDALMAVSVLFLVSCSDGYFSVSDLHQPVLIADSLVHDMLLHIVILMYHSISKRCSQDCCIQGPYLSLCLSPAGC